MVHSVSSGGSRVRSGPFSRSRTDRASLLAAGSGSSGLSRLLHAVSAAMASAAIPNHRFARTTLHRADRAIDRRDCARVGASEDMTWLSQRGRNP